MSYKFATDFGILVKRNLLIYAMMLITIICFLTTDSTVCNGDEQDTDSKSVDMESLSELKGQLIRLVWCYS